MKYIGLLFIVVSASSVGIQMAANLNRRCEMIRQFIYSLQVLRNEILVCGTYLPQAFALMAASVTTPLAEIYETIAKQMEKNRWLTPYDVTREVVDGSWDGEISRMILSLSQKLGKYDLQAQTAGIDAAAKEAEQYLQVLECEKRLKSRTYRTLGLCAGLAVAILLV